MTVTDQDLMDVPSDGDGEWEPESYPYGGTAHAPVAVAMPTAATQIIARNAKRMVAIIGNAGSTVIFLGRDNTVTAANGIPLAVGTIFRDDVGNDAWWGIVSTGSGDARVMEIVAS